MFVHPNSAPTPRKHNGIPSYPKLKQQLSMDETMLSCILVR